MGEHAIIGGSIAEFMRGEDPGMWLAETRENANKIQLHLAAAAFWKGSRVKCETMPAIRNGDTLVFVVIAEQIKE